MTQKYIDELSFKIIGVAIEVHKLMGKGLLESVYHQCLKEELKIRNLSFVSEMEIPVIYKNLKLKSDFRCDLFVENLIVIEIKATINHHPIFEAKLLNYMNLLKAPKGILINFHCNNIFREGQSTFVNDFYKKLPY